MTHDQIVSAAVQRALLALSPWFWQRSSAASKHELIEALDHMIGAQADLADAKVAADWIGVGRCRLLLEEAISRFCAGVDAISRRAGANDD